MSWLSKRDKLDPAQASGIDFVVAQEGMKKVEEVGGGEDAVAGLGLTRAGESDSIGTWQSVIRSGS